MAPIDEPVGYLNSTADIEQSEQPTFATQQRRRLSIQQQQHILNPSPPRLRRNTIQILLGTAAPLTLMPKLSFSSDIENTDASKLNDSESQIECGPCYLSKTRLCLLISVLNMLLLISLGIFGYLYLPVHIKHSFASGKLDGGWPPVDLSRITDSSIFFNLTYELPFTSIADTEISFEDVMTFSTGGKLIGNMTLPPLSIGKNRKHTLSQEFEANLLDTAEWVRLWKRWILRATNKNDLPTSLQAPTIWNITVPIRFKMLGITWRNVVLTKQMEWNGGLESDLPVKVAIKDWSLLKSINNPGINLTLSIDNSRKVGINFGQLEFSAYSVYRHNSSLSETVKMLDLRFPKFFYRPGIHNFTFANEFQLDERRSVTAASQIVTNFFRNRTTLLVLRDFKSYHVNNSNNGTSSLVTVEWLNEVLGSLSFLIQLNRVQSITDLFNKEANTFAHKMRATIDNLDDLSPIKWADIWSPSYNSLVPPFPSFGNDSSSSNMTIDESLGQNGEMSEADKIAISRLELSQLIQANHNNTVINSGDTFTPPKLPSSYLSEPTM